jgi:hypothetical protein
MAVGPPPARDRIRLYEGARLAARDLRDDQRYEERLRRLHVRGIHGTWGVAIGYEVGLTRGGGAVAVGPGIAYDCAGRALVSGRPVVLLPPRPRAGSTATSWWFDLVARYRDDESLLAARDPAGGSGPACASPFEERPELRWVFAGDGGGEAPRLAAAARLGEDVPLARFLVGAGGSLSEPDLSLRRNAQGLVRPHIAGGRVRQGSLAIAGSPLHWSVTIDTSDAGFDTSAPFYVVSLPDHPLGERSAFAPLLGPDPTEALTQLLGPFVSIDAEERTSFRLTVRSAFLSARAARQLAPGLFRALRLKLPVAVDWLGLEPIGGCPPAFEWPVMALPFLGLETFFPGLMFLSTSTEAGGGG